MKNFNFEYLFRSLTTTACFLKVENPVLVGDLSADQLATALLNYSILPARIVECLTSGHAATHGWSAVQEELAENIEDERGARTGGVAHYELLCYRVQVELGLNFRDAESSEETDVFINSILRSLQSQSAEGICTRARAAGVMLALESSAIPELAVVATIINRLAELKGKASVIRFGSPPEQFPADPFDLSLSAFFTMHIGTFEVDHRDHLAAAISKHLATEKEFTDLRDGYRETIDAMVKWWDALAQGK